jgi:hypothetical protein
VQIQAPSQWRRTLANPPEQAEDMQRSHIVPQGSEEPAMYTSRMKTGAAARLFTPLLFIASLLGALLLSGCKSPSISVDKTWFDGQNVCVLVTISNVPPPNTHRITIIINSGQVGTKSFEGSDGTHTICIAIPGDVGPNRTVTVNVYGSSPADPEPTVKPGADKPEADRQKWDADSKKWQKINVADATAIKDLPQTAPPLPAGTTAH